MKTVIIYGVEHKGNTYHAVQLFKEQLNILENDITEYFLPKDLPYFCSGCGNCILNGEESCPHHSYVAPIISAMEKADFIILASPVFAFRVTGQMKAFLDHLAFQLIGHRPNETMFSKMALVVTTGFAIGVKSATKDMSMNLRFWGIGNIYKFGFPLFAIKWNDIPIKKKLKVEKKIEIISKKIKSKRNKKLKPNFLLKRIFNMCKSMQKKTDLFPHDKQYWMKKGWLDTNYPWKK